MLDRIRTACATVAERASRVHLRRDLIAPYAASLPVDQAHLPELDRQQHYTGSSEEMVAFFLTLDAINFGSGYFPHLRKPPGLSGYFTIASALNRRFRAEGPFSARELTNVASGECAEMFGQERSGPAGELMEHFATALRDLGNFLVDRYDGRFVGPLEAARGSAETLVGILGEMPYFQDVASYGDLAVPFYKRAQLTAADLSLALDGQGWGYFRDLDRLTLFADNLVPHVLRVDGLLSYEASLAGRIEAGELIKAGSAEEIEIRAVALHAVELLVAELRSAGQKVNAAQLDYLLWNRGQQPAYKAIPRHRARSVFY